MENLPFAAQLSYLDLVPEYLVPCDVIRLDTGEEFNPVLKNGTLSQKSRVEISSRKARYEKIVEGSLQYIKGQAIYYAGSVSEAMGVVAEYKKLNVSAVAVHSKWTEKGDKINAIAIEKFRKGDVQILVNVQMLAMGFDVPNVETIIVARPVESDTLFTQMVGRGARPAEGKTRFILIMFMTRFQNRTWQKSSNITSFLWSRKKSEIPGRNRRHRAVEMPGIDQTLAYLPWNRGPLDSIRSSFSEARL